jgi:hypothetical protein
MSYQVLARKWRPRLFPELVGQEHVVRALVNALDHDRLPRGVAHGHGGDVRFASPALEEIVGEQFQGAAFYLVIPDRPGPAPSEPLTRRPPPPS